MPVELMRNPFNFPSVDHLVEGVHYRVVEWSFADAAPVEKQKPEETVQPAQQNAPAPASAPTPAAAPQAQAGAAPAPQPQAQASACKPDEKSVFGVCRKIGGQPADEKDFDSSAKTDQEKTLESEAKKQGSDVKNNKPVMIGDKKYGWAVKGGKPVLVEWASVAGAKPAAKPQVKGASGGPKPLSGRATPKPQQPATMQQGQAPQSNPAAKIAELQQAMKVPGLPPAAQKALQAAIDLMGA
jgi:hypothetical protein